MRQALPADLDRAAPHRALLPAVFTLDREGGCVTLKPCYRCRWTAASFKAAASRPVLILQPL